MTQLTDEAARRRIRERTDETLFVEGKGGREKCGGRRRSGSGGMAMATDKLVSTDDYNSKFGRQN